jgi:ferredoxin
MSVVVDKEKCIGCGLCVSMCPDVFEFKDDNKAHVKASACKGCDVKQVAQSCPVQAITAK